MHSYYQIRLLNILAGNYPYFLLVFARAGRGTRDVNVPRFWYFVKRSHCE